MKKRSRTIDINAHISNLTCDINVQDGTVTALIGFDNLAYGTITAIKFDAVGYNSFGDVVTIDGKEKFFLIIQDISVGKNETAENLKAVLPNADVRRLVLEESQICFADGSVVTYEGKQEFTFEFEEFDSEQPEEKEEREAVENKFGRGFIYKPQNYTNGWICGCGCFNKLGGNQCISCGAVKEEAFSVCSSDTLKELVGKYRIAEEERKAAAQKEKEQKEKEQKQKKIKIGIGGVIAAILAVFIGYSSMMSGRTTYPSEYEMKKALKGTYTHYTESGTASKQIMINSDSVTIKWSMGDELGFEVTAWNYKKGTFETFEKYTVLSDGNIKDEDGDLYEKGGYMSTGAGKSGYTSSYENGYNKLDVTDLAWDNNSSYTVCTGKVKNNGQKTYYFVEVKGSFKDSKGSVLDTDWTYAVGSEGLAPGESSSFRLSVDRDYDISDCTVRVLDFD